MLFCKEDERKVMKEEPCIVISPTDDKLPEDKYLSWKNQTLALQTSHKAEKQRTGLWQDFKDINVVENINYRGEQNEFLVELAPGWRYGRYYSSNLLYYWCFLILGWLLVVVL